MSSSDDSRFIEGDFSWSRGDGGKELAKEVKENGTAELSPLAIIRAYVFSPIALAVYAGVAFVLGVAETVAGQISGFFETLGGFVDSVFDSAVGLFPGTVAANLPPGVIPTPGMTMPPAISGAFGFFIAVGLTLLVGLLVSAGYRYGF